MNLARNLGVGPDWELLDFGGSTLAFDVADIDYIVYVQDAAIAPRSETSLKVDTLTSSTTVPVPGDLRTMAFEPVRQNLTYLYTSGGEATVGCYDRVTQGVTESSLLDFPTDVRQAIFDLEHSYVYVLNDKGTDLEVWSIAYGQWLANPDKITLQGATRLAMDPLGNRLVVFDQDAGILYKLAFDGVAFSVHDAVALTVPDPQFPSDEFRLAIGRFGEVYYTCGDTNVWLLTPGATSPVIFASTALTDPDDVQVGSSGNVVYVADQVNQGSADRPLRSFDADGYYLGDYGDATPVTIWDDLAITSAPNRQDLPTEPNMPPGFDALWIGGVGDWSVPSNWASTEVPTGPDFDVFVGADTDVARVDMNPLIKSLFNAGTVAINNGNTLEFTEEIMHATGGQLQVNMGFNATSTLRVAGSLVTLTGEGAIRLNGEFASDAVLDIPFGTTLIQEAGHRIGHVPGDVDEGHIRGPGTLRNRGTIIANGASIPILVLSDLMLINENDGVLRADPGKIVLLGSNDISGGRIGGQNGGVVQALDASFTDLLHDITVDGQVTIPNGKTLAISGQITTTGEGVIQVNEGFNATSILRVAGPTVTLTGEGAIRLNGEFPQDAILDIPTGTSLVQEAGHRIALLAGSDNDGRITGLGLFVNHGLISAAEPPHTMELRDVVIQNSPTGTFRNYLKSANRHDRVYHKKMQASCSKPRWLRAFLL